MRREDKEQSDASGETRREETDERRQRDGRETVSGDGVERR